MTNTDIVIIGAGAAGVGAGLELAERGVDCVVLEAQARIGGRAFTDRTSLPVAWDQGCHWLHCADVNPLVAWADRLGAVYDTHRRGDWFGLWRDGIIVGEAERVATWARIEDAFAEIYAAGSGADVSVEAVMSEAARADPLVRHWIQLMASDDPEVVSVTGYADYEDTELNFAVLSGYGALIEAMARPLPVRTGVTVRHIEQGANGVRVETDAGSIEARGCIVTASTNVLLAEALTISAGPARDLLDLMQQVPCGAYEKIAIALKSNPFPALGLRSLTVQPDEGEPLNFQVVAGETTLAIGHVAGSVARELTAAGDAAMADFALERLVKALGGGVGSQVAAIATTGWSANPHVRGGYSYSRPGGAVARRRMIEADTGNVAFAGEAFSLKWEATAHGAYQSGRDVAGRLVDTLKLA